MEKGQAKVPSSPNEMKAGSEREAAAESEKKAVAQRERKASVEREADLTMKGFFSLKKKRAYSPIDTRVLFTKCMIKSSNPHQLDPPNIPPLEYNKWIDKVEI
eukprot:scaffold212044_cov67-Cyclotella_meneghiniana.AAC.1